MSDTAARARLEATKKRAEKFAIDNGWASDSDPVIADLAAFAEGERELWFEQLAAQSAAQVEEVAREILDGIRGKDCATDAEHNYVKHILRQHGYGAQGQGVGPRCPEHKVAMVYKEDRCLPFWACSVDGCALFLTVDLLKEVSQFFPSVPSPESATKRCEVCGATENLTVMGRNQYACPEHRATPLHGICPNCGADRSGPSAEAHAANCPESATKEGK